MKKVFQITLALLLPVWMSAQVCPEYFPLKTGNSWETTHYSKKDKVESVNTCSVKSVTEMTNGYEAVVNTTAFNEKGETEGTGDLVMKCLGGVFFLDMKNFLDTSAFEQSKDMTATMTATDMEFPATLTEGDKLPDASITYQMSTNGMVVMTMSVNITERVVGGKESITTPAGTFEVWKITSRFQSKSGFITMKFKTTEYVSLGAGIVKTEAFNDKGELQSYSMLTKLSKL